MALTAAQLLALFDAAIVGRFDGELYDEYTEAQVNRVKMMPVTDLLKWREYYASKVAAESGGVGAATHYLAEPFPPGIA